MNYICVAAGGAVGALLRYVTGKIVVKPENGFPLGTFIINVIGAFCIGLITAFAVKMGLQDSKWILFLKVGVCGGFTTFSTFSLESYDLMTGGKPVTGVIYMAVSVVCCVLAVWLAESIVARS